jgi:outer membrane protein assembly factor BamA
VYILFFVLLSQNVRAQKDRYFLDYAVIGEDQGRKSKLFADSTGRERFLKDKIFELQHQGFLLAKQGDKFHTGDSLAVDFLPGEKYHWVGLVPGNLRQDILVKSGFDDRVFAGKPVAYPLLLKMFEKILATAENHGYPFAAVRLDSLKQEGNGLFAAIDYEEGPFISFDTIKITGDSKTDPAFLARLLHMTPGASYSQKKIDQSISRLQNLPYLRLTEEPTLSFQNSEATLYLPIQDRRINTIDGIIGFLPNEMEENKLLVTGQFDLALYNVGGKGRNYAASWQRLSQYSQNLDLMAEEPMVFGSHLDLKGRFHFLKQDTSFLNRDFRVDVGYRINPHVYMSFFSRWQAGGLLGVSQYANAQELPEVADFRFNNYGAHLDWNRLDDVFFPRRGIFGSFEFGLGNKRLLENTGLPEHLYRDMELQTLQYYITAQLEKHFYFRPNLGVMASIAGGEIQSGNLLLNDLYRIGGLRSIRGFNENFFFANRYVYMNLEPRFYFDSYSYFMIFADIGRLENQFRPNQVDWPRAIGSGINLDTGGGMFRFIFALGHSSLQPFAFNYSKIHFGYTGRF